MHESILIPLYFLKIVTQYVVNGSISGIRAWSYVSVCGEYHYHIRCATEIMF